MLATVIISIILAAWAATVIRSMVQKKKQGKSSCGCGCENCAMRSTCRK